MHWRLAADLPLIQKRGRRRGDGKTGIKCYLLFKPMFFGWLVSSKTFVRGTLEQKFKMRLDKFVVFSFILVSLTVFNITLILSM